jgi:hypothetical protein
VKSREDDTLAVTQVSQDFISKKKTRLSRVQAGDKHTIRDRENTNTRDLFGLAWGTRVLVYTVHHTTPHHSNPRIQYNLITSTTYVPSNTSTVYNTSRPNILQGSDPSYKHARSHHDRRQKQLAQITRWRWAASWPRNGAAWPRTCGARTEPCSPRTRTWGRSAGARSPPPRQGAWARGR